MLTWFWILFPGFNCVNLLEFTLLMGQNILHDIFDLFEILPILDGLDFWISFKYTC